MDWFTIVITLIGVVVTLMLGIGYFSEILKK